MAAGAGAGGERGTVAPELAKAWKEATDFAANPAAGNIPTSMLQPLLKQLQGRDKHHLPESLAARIMDRDVNGRTVLHLASVLENSAVMAVVAAATSAGADVNAADIHGSTPLHEACASEGGSMLVRALLKHGADCEARDRHGRVAVHRAAIAGHPANIQALLDKDGARGTLDLVDIDGVTALAAAAALTTRKVTATINALIEAGANPNAVDKYGATPLHRAATSPAAGDAVAALISVADLEATNDRGQTPLHDAAYEGKLEAVRLLLEAGASPGSPDKDGNTPLHAAAAGGHHSVCAALLHKLTSVAAEALVASKNRHGELAVDLAVATGSSGENAARFLREKQLQGATRDFLVTLFKSSNPGKLDTVDELLAEYRGREAELVSMLQQQKGSKVEL